MAAKGQALTIEPSRNPTNDVEDVREQLIIDILYR